MCLSLFLCAILSLYILLIIDILSFSLRRSGWRRFASTFLLFYAQVVATEFILGAISLLYPSSLVVLNVLLTTCVLLFLQKKYGAKIFSSYFVSLGKTFSTFRHDLRGDPASCVVITLAVLFVAWVIFLGIIFPATDWDGNGYHLAFVGDLIQNHNFYDVPSSLPWLIGYPKGGEFIQAWSVLVSHNDTFADLTQVPFLLLAVYALYEVAASFGVDKKHARFSALLFVFLPIVLNQLKTAYIDVMFCAAFFGGLAIVLQKQLSKLDLILIGILFSLLISIKSTGAYFVAALFLMLAWRLYRLHGKNVKQYMRPLLLLATPMTFGLYWYVKDLIAYSSPIYPFGLQFGGRTIFPGINYQTWSVAATGLPHGYLQRLWFVWTEQGAGSGFAYNYDSNFTGFGPLWFVILIPAFLASLYIAVRKRNLPYLAVSVIIGAIFIIYPTNFSTRYTMFITALGILGLGIVLGSIHRYTAFFIRGLSIALILLVIGTTFTLNYFTPGLIKGQFKSLLAGSDPNSRYTTDANLGQAYTALDDHIQAGQIVVYDSYTPFIYPLWNRNYSDKVIFISASNERSWYHQVLAKHATYIFTGRSSKENKWSNDRFKDIIYQDTTYEIFKIN